VDERAGILEPATVADLLDRRLALVGEGERSLQVTLGGLVRLETPRGGLVFDAFGDDGRLLELHESPVAARRLVAVVEPLANPFPFVLVGHGLVLLELRQECRLAVSFLE
jgi:hypothetical protein